MVAENPETIRHKLFGTYYPKLRELEVSTSDDVSIYRATRVMNFVSARRRLDRDFGVIGQYITLERDDAARRDDAGLLVYDLQAAFADAVFSGTRHRIRRDYDDHRTEIHLGPLAECDDFACHALAIRLSETRGERP